MRLKEFIQPETDNFTLSPEDEAKILDTIALGESAWSEPMTLEEAIAITNKLCGYQE